MRRIPLFLALLFALVLAVACGTTGQQRQDTAQGAVDQNIRGGIFASYTGKHGAGVPGRTVVTRTRTGQAGETTTEVVEVMSGAPFVMLFDESSIQADTDAGNQGSQTGSGTQGKTDTATPSTTVDTTASATGQ